MANKTRTEKLIVKFRLRYITDLIKMQLDNWRESSPKRDLFFN